MLKSSAVQKISIKIPPGDFAKLDFLVSQLLHARVLIVGTGITAYQMRNGVTLEFYSADAIYPPFLFKSGNICVSFRVEDLEQARDELQGMGVKIVSEINEICPTLSYCHVEIFDGSIIGLFQQK